MNFIYERLATFALALMVAGLILWQGWPLGVVAALPLGACLPFAALNRPRAFVLAGTLALPYMAWVMVEILSGTAAPFAARLMLGGAFGFMALLMPATRHASAARNATVARESP